ncbi:agmatine deiminase family protein [Tropicibacter sp. Alg240-R139]|uniref:agmatine deiminase family protein n=1 Tax=Tropicibacter sp. Alg240-R139 TaxID=2305991 RepID=UPI0013E05171|nr:agmatine deiminase family protein [Tropicibacter sp. Alg240-R139]
MTQASDDCRVPAQEARRQRTFMQSPVFSKNSVGQLSVRGVNFNGWGRRYHLRDDEQIARPVVDRMGLPFLQ